MLYNWETGLQPERCSDLGDVLGTEQIRHLCCRSGCTVVVLSSGKIFRRVDGKPPGQFPYSKDQKIHFAACGTSQVLFVSATGSILQSQVNSKRCANNLRGITLSKPQLFRSLSGSNIIQVTCGNNHSLALSKDGQVFAWGQNTFGQLGLGTRGPLPCDPQTVKSFSGVPVAQITAGGEHSFALTVSGTVFAWGRNNHGQLGLDDTEDTLTPKHVQILSCKSTIFISCGEEHTAVLTKDGFVLTFGAGAHGQLGHNSTRDEIKPRLVGGLFGRKVSQIACGSYHTLALVSSTGTVYSFGCGEMIRLGNGQTSEHSVPLPINLIDTASNGGADNGSSIKRGVRKIFAGGKFSFAECYDEENLLSSQEESLLTLKRIVPLTNLFTKKAIIRGYSSSPIMNASFLDTSKDNHFKTSQMLSGLDMSLVYLNFENLAKDTSLLSQVTNAILTKLIPSLPRSPASLEALRVYLVLPELIAVLDGPKSSKLTESLTTAILSLEGSYFKVLECWWKAIPVYFFKRLVRIYHDESKQLLHLAMTDISKNTSELKKSLQILQTLYKVNSTRDDQIREWRFNIPVIKMFKELFWAFVVRKLPGIQIPLDQFINEMMYGFQSYSLQWAKLHLAALRKILGQLIPYPCIFNIDTKLAYLKLETQIMQNNAIQPQVTVSRTSALQDIIQWYRTQYGLADFTALLVTFNNESCYGHGVTQEFFTLLSKDLQDDTSIFEHYSESGFLWFPSRESGSDDVFHLVGTLCGIALFNGHIANFHFPLALYKKLLHVQPTLEDLKEFSPTHGASLQYVLDYEYDDIEEELGQNFTVIKDTEEGAIVELIADGANTLVQKHNRKQFVEAYVDYKLNTAVENQFKAFFDGFRRGFPLPIVDLFHPEELMAIIHGNTNYEWELLKQNAMYQGYFPTDRIILYFWEVFESLLEEEKKQLIAFLSGSERILAGGIGRFIIKILRPRNVDDPDLSYPRAYTCTKSLELPNYSNKDLLRVRLLHAIECLEFCAVPP
ncbi:probable E3 ubiquitin-protein ligase HERC3 isoform X2 [Leucoraja erinacea]|uniref:probable E3 ubiquitin-protein ligase HERC3 isoform X2 n=1 Tax=Leucoraja erinaceus TaxID=7782 RepID=UPI002458CC1A|nr:probable E3 ubiquitin-protein ligase HERC3 isoform X2 [Leucoraja erinacea]